MKKLIFLSLFFSAFAFSGSTDRTLEAKFIQSGVGLLALPQSKDTLVGRATVDTLTNKSISGTTNTFTAIPYTAVSGQPLDTVITKTNANSPYSVTLVESVILCDASAGPVLINLLPISSALNKRLVVKKIDSSPNACTLDGNLSETLDGVTIKVLDHQYQGITIVDGGTEWNVL